MRATAILIGCLVVSVCFGQVAEDDAVVVRKILDDNGLTGIDVAAVSSRDENNRIVSLNLDNSEMGSEGVRIIPGDIGKLTALKHLSLRRNVLKSLPEAIGNLTVLETLDLAYNDIQSMPSTITRCSNLRKLDLRYNDLEAIPEVAGLKSLWFLQLWGNKITVLPAGITSMPLLKELYLNNNRLSALPDGIMRMKSLTYVDFRENNICNPSPALEKWMTQKEEKWKYYMNCAEGPVKRR
jgi:Leucine-rich repeat (LRR) protein